MAAALFAFAACAKNAPQEKITTEGADMQNKKTAVVYFSVYEHTKKYAETIQKLTGADILRIETEKPYDSDTSHYEQLAEYAKKERDNDERPAIKPLDLSKYDTVFVGYPIWLYTLPMPMYTFFDKYDFAGKTIIPFNTHEGSGDGGTYETIRKFEPEAAVLQGLPIQGESLNKDQTAKIKLWLENLGFRM